jgi:tetratricopeptide (TPR) repeat protein
MNASTRKLFRAGLLGGCLCVAGMTLAQNTQKPATVQGIVRDADERPLAGATVRLEQEDSTRSTTASTDAQGHFQFVAVLPGSYSLRAMGNGYGEKSEGPFGLHAGETKSIILHLTKLDPAAAIPFSDEPQFTVAGVSDTTALGVHSSSRSLPNSNALAKDTAALSHEENPNLGAPSADRNASSEEVSLRAKLATQENADLRFQLAALEEKDGKALVAEKDYQRAAELAPTEAHLFGWGAELLLHRALEPAIEVFRKGHLRYPQSVRMLLGLGAAEYAQGSREEAAQIFLQASDLDPANPQPYLFVGRLLATDNLALRGWTERLKHFAAVQPQNGEAHYLYGLALMRQGKGSATEAEAKLNKAIELDPHLGGAYLQLGILRSERKDFAGAVAALQKAVECMPLPDEAHYRLAEVYRQTGDTEKALQETALYKEISEQKAQQAERERHEIPQFIYTLGGSAAPPQPTE